MFLPGKQTSVTARRETRLQTDIRNRRVGRRRRQSAATYRCVICLRAETQNYRLCAHTKKNKKKDARHDHPQLSSTFLNLNCTQEQFTKLEEKKFKEKKIEVGYGYGPSVEIRMFSPSKKNEKKKPHKKQALQGVLLENVYTLSFCFCWYLPRKLWNCCFVWPHP